MKYKIHRFQVKLSRDQDKLENFLNSLSGDVVAVIPNVSMGAFWIHRIDFLLIVEKIHSIQK